MRRAFQDSRQKKKLGDRTPWSVGWYDPEGRKRSKRIGSRSMAEKRCRKIEGQLAAGTYESEKRCKWKQFRAEYEEKIAEGMSGQSRRCTLDALGHFERLVKPNRMDAIKTATIDAYVAKRRLEPGRKKNSQVAIATINKELRHLKAVLRVAHDWEYIRDVPKIRMLKESKRLPRFVTPTHFAAIFNACDAATMPKGLPYPAADWWRALLTFAYMTGWRINEIHMLRRDDLDLENATAVTRAADNKGKRDDLIPLHPVVTEQLQHIASFEPRAFPWYHHERTLWSEFAKVQTAAGIHLDCREDHQHTDACHLYGFHDLRRAFATVNAETLTADALQTLMRHRSYVTTQRYINMAHQINRSVEKLHVPDVLRKSANG